MAERKLRLGLVIIACHCVALGPDYDYCKSLTTKKHVRAPDVERICTKQPRSWASLYSDGAQLAQAQTQFHSVSLSNLKD